MKELLAALDLESIPQVSLGTAALLIFGACASLAVLRGLLRILAGTVILCASGFAAHLAWRHGPALPGHDLPGFSAALPLVTGIAAFFLLRAILKFVVRPFGKPNEEVAGANRRSPLRWAFTLFFSLVPAALLWFTGAAALRHFGSIAEIRNFAGNPAGPHPRSSFLAALKDTIDRAMPENWFLGIAPFSDDARVTLAKLIAAGDAPPKAIPVMEEPEIRALILEDEKLRRLAKAGRYADILRDPRLDYIMENPDLRKMLAGLEL